MGPLRRVVFGFRRFTQPACESQLDADNRLDAKLFRSLGELHYAAHVVVVGYGECVDAKLFGSEQKVPGFGRPFLKRVVAVTVQLRPPASGVSCARRAGFSARSGGAGRIDRIWPLVGVLSPLPWGERVRVWVDPSGRQWHVRVPQQSSTTSHTKRV